MTQENLEIAKLKAQMAQLENIVKVLGQKVAFLERENNRRRAETNQIASVLRK